VTNLSSFGESGGTAPSWAGLHHGGAGTTFATLSAGLPSVVTSIFADQPYWGALVAKRGAGAHLPFRRLNRSRLESSLSQVLHPGVVKTSKALGARLAGEPDACPKVIQIVESLRA
jgi:sterol 3beta-glucosyltransferase